MQEIIEEVKRQNNNALRGVMGLDLNPIDFWSEGLLWEKIWKDIRRAEPAESQPAIIQQAAISRFAK